MAVEIFLRLDGVTGSSRNYHHKGWSDVVSWSWSLSSNRTSASKSADDITSMDQINVVKRTGIDSPAIMSLFAEARCVPRAEISIVPVVGKREAQQKLVSIAMEDVLIRSLATGGTTEDSVFTETLTLLFQRIRFEFHQFADATPAGIAAGAESYGFGWDITQRVAW